MELVMNDDGTVNSEMAQVFIEGNFDDMNISSGDIAAIKNTIATTQANESIQQEADAPSATDADADADADVDADVDADAEVSAEGNADLTESANKEVEASGEKPPATDTGVTPPVDSEATVISEVSGSDSTFTNLPPLPDELKGVLEDVTNNVLNQAMEGNLKDANGKKIGPDCL